MASEKDNQEPKKGFAGLSSMVSNVDLTVDHVEEEPPPRQEDAPQPRVQARPDHSETKSPGPSLAKDLPSGQKTHGIGWTLGKQLAIGLGVLIGVLWLVSKFENRGQPSSPNHPTSGQVPVQTQPVSAAPLNEQPSSAKVIGYFDEKPPVGQNLVLELPQVRYCLGEDVRIDAARAVLSNGSDSKVARFNEMVSDYNSRCGSYKYRRGTLETARAEVEKYRAFLVAEGKGRFEKSSIGEKGTIPVGDVVEIDQVLPEVTLPANGKVRDFSSAERIAPFEIKAAQGAHYLIKLVDVDTRRPAMTVFVRRGMTVETEVPVGSYEVRYASGDKWYGYDHLFGADTTYSKADKILTFEITGDTVSGHSITLYRVQNGNLSTSGIRPEDF